MTPGSAMEDPARATRPASNPLLIALVVSAAATVAITFVPWHQSGATSRNSYELLASAERLEIVDGAALRGLAMTWPLVPLAAALGGVTLALKQRSLGVAMVFLAACLETAGSLIVLRASSDLRWGPSAALAVGVITVGLAISCAASNRNSSSVE